MDPLPGDIIVRLILDQEDGIDARLLADAVSAVETAARQVARQEIEAFRISEIAPRPPSELGRINVAVDAALERLRRFDGSYIRFVQAREGSLVLAGTVVAVGYWTLEKTLGESFGEGWKSSHTHKHLSEWFRELVDGAASRLANAAKRSFARKKVDADVRQLGPSEDAVEIRVRPVRRPQLVPRYGKLRSRLADPAPKSSTRVQRQIRFEEGDV
jgi:hypothetical protein